MDIRKLQRAIVDGLEDVKAQNIAVFNTEHLSPLFERVIIASGTSNRQTKALAASVRDSVKSRGMQVLSVEGEDNGEWIIVDCGAAVAHIMQPSIRDYYHLEEIWGGKAVRMKVATPSAGLVKAAPAPRAAAKAGAMPAAPAAAPGRRAAAEPAAKTAGRGATGRAGAGKATAGKPAKPRSAAAPRGAAARPARPAAKRAPRKISRSG